MDREQSVQQALNRLMDLADGDNLNDKVVNLEMHAHRCICGEVWHHTEACAGNTKAHTCSKCGKQQWQRAHGRLTFTGKFQHCEPSPLGRDEMPSLDDLARLLLDRQA